MAADAAFSAIGGARDGVVDPKAEQSAATQLIA